MDGRGCPSRRWSSIARSGMFRNLATSTKLILLSGTFVVAIIVAIYSLVAEKQIAIQFAQKELLGVAYFERLRDVYSYVLIAPASGVTGENAPSLETALESLAAAERAAQSSGLGTAALAQSLNEALRIMTKDPSHDGEALLG